METMAKRETVLRVTDLMKKYGDHVIVERFNLTVQSGEAIALTGRNGSDKSTLLRCIIGADRPSEGRVEVFGRKVAETDPEFRREVATVVDDLDFFPDLSVVEHLDLLARAHGLADPDALVDEVLDEVQLVPQSGQLPGTLYDLFFCHEITSFIIFIRECGITYSFSKHTGINTAEQCSHQFISSKIGRASCRERV